MPNWCDNQMVLSGPADKIKALWESSKNGQQLLEAMVPIGEWDYSRAVDAWGTKWDVAQNDLSFTQDGNDATIRGWFETAWSPPVMALQNYCDANKDVRVTLEYFEPGVGFIGHWNSGAQEDICYEIDPGNLDALPSDLREAFNVDSWYDTDEDAA